MSDPSVRGIQDQLPLSESTFFILLSLAPKPKHGYAIMKDVYAMSDGRINLSTGTLYGALKRLLEQNWIERLEHDPHPDERSQFRKAYSPTDLGRRILNAEIARLQSLVRVAQLHTSEEQT